MDDDNDNRQSPDDWLEPRDDIFNPLTDEDRLDEDNDSPAAPADDIHSRVPLDDPSTDDGIDSDELYQEGISGATNADDDEIEPDDRPEPVELEHED